MSFEFAIAQNRGSYHIITFIQTPESKWKVRRFHHWIVKPWGVTLDKLFDTHEDAVKYIERKKYVVTESDRSGREINSTESEANEAEA